MKKLFLFLAIFSLIFSAESYAKAKKKKNIKPRVTNIYKTIPPEYFLQINLTQSECEKTLNVSAANKTECFRRDKMRDEPYYHKSKITIFNGKIFAEQFSAEEDRQANQVFLTVKNGSYKLSSSNSNSISFSVKDGLVSDLKLLQGNLAKEKKLESKCDVSEAIYGFYKANNSDGIVEKNIMFNDEFNFNGLKDLQIFIEKSNPQKAMSLTLNDNNSFEAIDNIRICKMPNSENYFLRRISDEGCKLGREETILECTKYSSCEDYLIIKDCEVTLLKDLVTWYNISDVKKN
jgi:hypothetical protein